MISGCIRSFGAGISRSICRGFTCPALVIQGLDDQYGTMAQVEAIRRQSGGPVEVLALEDCQHSPQRDQPEKVIEAVGKFVAAVRGNN